MEGYIIDMLDELKKNTSIEFTPVTPVPDGKYGSRVGRDWNGMIGELKHNVCEPVTQCFSYKTS